MHQAMQEGAAIVGGLDPHTVDEHIEKSLHAMVDLAVQHQAGSISICMIAMSRASKRCSDSLT